MEHGDAAGSEGRVCGSGEDIHPSPETDAGFPGSQDVEHQGDPTASDGILSRERLRAYMLTHSVKGSKIMPKRSKYNARPVTVASPIDPAVEFRIKRVGTREMVAKRDDNAIVRYITRESETGLEYLSEKEFPEGTREVETIVLCLDGWNLTGEDDKPLPITEDTIKDYLQPEEFDYLYTQCMEINPILEGVNARKSKAKTDSPSTGGVSTGGNDTPAVRDVLPTEPAVQPV